MENNDAKNQQKDLFAAEEAKRAKAAENRRRERESRKARERRAKQRKFLAAYAACGCIEQAGRDSGVSREVHYTGLATDPEYQADFRIAQENVFRFLRAKNELAKDFVEQDAWRKAFQGEPRKKFTAKGLPVIDPATGEQYVEFEKSERLHIEILRKLAPEYRNSINVIQQTDIKIEQQLPADLAAMDASITPPNEAMRRALAKAAVKQIEGGGGTNGNGNGHGPGQPDATA